MGFEIILVFLASTYAFWLLYMVYASFHTARRSGVRINRFSYAMFIPVLVVGYPLDIAWNTIFGSLLYLEWPWAESWKPWTWTFTGRASRWLMDRGWRGAQSRFWRDTLDPFDQGHL